MMYPGTLARHQGLDIAVKAVDKIKETIPEAELHIYGKGESRDAIAALIKELGLQERVFLHDMLPKEQIAGVMAEADLGIVPKRNDSFGGEAFSTKILEFMSLGVPVVVSATKIDRHYFNDSVVRFFEPENETSLAAAIVELARDNELRKDLAGRAKAFVDQGYDWKEKKELYLNIVDSLAARGS